MPNLFDVLSRDCGEVKQVLAGLETGPAAATGTDDNAAERLGVAAEPVINAVVLDVGEALVDETRECGTWADWLEVPRHTFSAVFGAPGAGLP